MVWCKSARLAGQVLERSTCAGSLLVVVALSVAGGPAGAAAQELGHVFVEVLDRAGRPVPGLTAADFALQENNVDLDVVSVRCGTASRLAAGYERVSMQSRVSYVPSGADDAQIMVG